MRRALFFSAKGASLRFREWMGLQTAVQGEHRGCVRWVASRAARAQKGSAPPRSGALFPFGQSLLVAALISRLALVALEAIRRAVMSTLIARLTFVAQKSRCDGEEIDGPLDEK